jgi:hypothetical protein
MWNFTSELVAYMQQLAPNNGLKDTNSGLPTSSVIRGPLLLAGNLTHSRHSSTIPLARNAFFTLANSTALLTWGQHFPPEQRHYSFNPLSFFRFIQSVSSYFCYYKSQWKFCLYLMENDLFQSLIHCLLSFFISFIPLSPSILYPTFLSNHFHISVISPCSPFPATTSLLFKSHTASCYIF